MNIYLQNQPITDLYICDAVIKKLERLYLDFSHSFFIGLLSRVHLDMTSDRVLLDVWGSVAYYNS